MYIYIYSPEIPIDSVSQEITRLAYYGIRLFP